MADDREDLIQSPEQAKHVIENMGAPELKEKRRKYHHAAVVSQGIKMVNSAIKDPFVRKVMTLRMLGPAITGNPRSYVSIAIELGAREIDVRQAEAYGVNLISELMKRVELPEFIGRYNSERAVNNAVKEMGIKTKANPVNNRLPK